MLISEKCKFTFLAPPKTGTRSVYRLLSNEKFSGELIGDHKHIVPQKYQNFYTFIVVRNPYYRMLSLYLSCCIEEGDVKGFLKDMKEVGLDLSFNSFLKWILINRAKYYALNQSKYLILKSQAAFVQSNKIDLIIKYENLDEDLKLLPFISNEDKLPFLNKTKIVSDKVSWFNDENIKLINEYCKDEFSLFNYKEVKSLIEFKSYFE